MKNYLILIVVIGSCLITTCAFALSKAEKLANTLGVPHGYSIYCGWNSDELVKRTQKALKAKVISKKDESNAFKQWFITSEMAATYGPGMGGETCSQYRSSYNEMVKILKNQGY